MTVASNVKELVVDWGESDKDESERRIWLAAWLVDKDGTEGDFFYDGRGGQTTTHQVPAEAVGFRLRWWPAARDDNSSALGSRQPTISRPYYFDELGSNSVNAMELQ